MFIPFTQDGGARYYHEEQAVYKGLERAAEKQESNERRGNYLFFNQGDELYFKTAAHHL